MELEQGTMTQSVAGGGCLVWEDLTVTLNSTKHLLNGLTGFAQSQRIMAVMGPSGSGKSTFLDALAGRVSQKAEMKGKVLITGKKTQSSIVSSRDVTYVTQQDVFLGTLTVKETLCFGARLRLPELNKDEVDEVVEDVMVKMGLEECADTTIGNWHLRGISGGERRRLSIGVEILAQPYVLCLDEPTTGLDSAASFFVVQALRNIARDGKVVVCSIHQPTNEVFRLFDDLLIISAGETVYFGETHLAVKFFADCGFPCPIRRNPPDHFLRCITPEFDQVFTALKQTQRLNYAELSAADGLLNLTTAETRATLVKKYNLSGFPEIARETIRELQLLHQNDDNDRSSSEVISTRKRKIGKQKRWWKQFCTLTHRSFLHMTRDLGYYWLRILFYIMVSLSTGTLEFDIGTSSASIIARAKVDGFLYGLMICLSIGGLPFFLDEIKAFHGERHGGYYGEGAYVLSNYISSLPFTIVISLSSGSILYSMVKFNPGFSHMLYFCVNLYFCISVSEACVFVISALISSPLPSMGASVAVTVLNLMPSIVFRPIPDLPKIIWRYPLSYISYAAWGTQGNMKNDMMGLEFDNAIPGRPKIKGETILENTYGVNLRYSKWLDVIALLCLLIAYKLLLVVSLYYKRKESSPFKRFFSRKRSQIQHPKSLITQ
ncbi:ABC transporter G family member 15 [Linum grandiflorum]